MWFAIVPTKTANTSFLVGYDDTDRRLLNGYDYKSLTLH